MQMQVKHRLPGLGAVIDYQPERIAHPRLPRHFPRRQQQMTEQRLIRIPGSRRVKAIQTIFFATRDYVAGWANGQSHGVCSSLRTWII